MAINLSGIKLRKAESTALSKFITWFLDVREHEDVLPSVALRVYSRICIEECGLEYQEALDLFAQDVFAITALVEGFM